MWPSARSAWPTRDSEDSGYRGALQESSLLWANTIPRQAESQSNVVVIINSVPRLAARWRVCRAPGVIGRSCSNHNKAPSLGRLSSMALSPRVRRSQPDFILHLHLAQVARAPLHWVQSLHLSVRGDANWGAGILLCLVPKASLGTSSGRACGQRPAREAVVRVVVGGLQGQKRRWPQHLSGQILSLVVTHQHLYGHFLGGGC